MSVTQRSALLTTLPKPNKSKFYLKNWRPISLLGVDYKIAPVVISNRIKKVLPTTISHTQKGFLKNRSIAENTKLIYDIIDKLISSSQEGLLLLVDFEKAFDSVEWNFFNEPFDILGITFFAETQRIAEHNYKKARRGQTVFRLMVLEASEHHWQNTGNQVTRSI